MRPVDKGKLILDSVQMNIPVFLIANGFSAANHLSIVERATETDEKLQISSLQLQHNLNAFSSIW